MPDRDQPRLQQPGSLARLLPNDADLLLAKLNRTGFRGGLLA